MISGMSELRREVSGVSVSVLFINENVLYLMVVQLTKSAKYNKYTQSNAHMKLFPQGPTPKQPTGL